MRTRRNTRIRNNRTKKNKKKNKMTKPKKVNGEVFFSDYPEFRPNLTPQQVLKMGSFGGTYFRPIYSSVTKKHYKSQDIIKEYPKSWFKGIDIEKMVTSSDYDKNVNKYKVKCGSELEDWEDKGWIKEQDPYGWFQWYCRFYRGRRTDDDERQIKRWMGVAGPNSRFKKRLINMIKNKGADIDDYTISPVIRQVLQHWGCKVTKKDLE